MPTDTQNETQKPLTDADAKNQFFSLPAKDLPSEIRPIYEYLKKRDSVENFVNNEYLIKNGIPAWDKALGTVTNIFINNATEKGGNSVNFIPLRDSKNGKILSYLYAVNVDGYVLTRLYNFAELQRFKPKTDEDSKKLYNIFLPFATFENKLNGKKKFIVGRGHSFTYEDADLKITPRNNDKGVQTRSCFFCFSYETWVVDYVRNGGSKWVTQQICVSLVCGGGGGGGGTGGGGGGTGGGGSSTTYNSNTLDLQGNVIHGTDPDVIHPNSSLHNNLVRADFSAAEIAAMTPKQGLSMTNYLVSNGYSPQNIEAVRYHYDFLNQDDAYFIANFQAGWPTFASEPWARILRFDSELSNPSEWFLAFRYPVAAIRVMINSQTASTYAQSLYPNHGPDDLGNAFKHAFWSALNTVDLLVGADLAKRFTDAHENTEGQPEIEKIMDLFNNSVGIDIGVRLFEPTSLPQTPVVITEIKNQIEAAVLIGHLKYNCFGILIFSNIGC